MRRLLIVAATVALLAGCTGAAEPETDGGSATSSESEASTADAPIDPESIESIDEGIAWARALDDTVAADELALGIDAITDHLLDQEIAFETSNEIGQALMALNDDVRSAPDTAGTRVVDLNAIVDRLETAIETGATP